MESSLMEVDESTNNFGNLAVHFIPGLKLGQAAFSNRVCLSNIDFNSCSITSLKNKILEETNQNSSVSLASDDFDLMTNGKILKGDSQSLGSLKLRPESIVFVVKNTNQSSTIPVVKYSSEQIRQISTALRTSFVNFSFSKTVRKLKDPEALKPIFSIAPGLESDLAAIALIQNPHLIFQVSEKESLAKLAETRPWILQALHHIAITVNSIKSSKTPRVPGNAVLAQLLNPALDNEDDDMDDDEDEEGGAQRPSASQPNLHGPITREQLALALNAANPGTSNPLSSLFSHNSFLRPSTAPTTLPSTPSPRMSNTDLQGLLASALSQIQGNSEVGNFMQQLNSMTPPSGMSSATTPTVPPMSVNIGGGEYGAQLAQMRALGIMDERLSILALRVSGGDVETASELILSGWDGSGAEPENTN